MSLYTDEELDARFGWITATLLVALTFMFLCLVAIQGGRAIGRASVPDNTVPPCTTCVDTP